MSDQVIQRFIGEVKQTLSQHAEDSMEFPKAEPFEHGLQVGKYQGIQYALNILEVIMRDDRFKESQS